MSILEPSEPLQYIDSTCPTCGKLFGTTLDRIIAEEGWLMVNHANPHHTASEADYPRLESSVTGNHPDPSDLKQVQRESGVPGRSIQMVSSRMEEPCAKSLRENCKPVDTTDVDLEAKSHVSGFRESCVQFMENARRFYLTASFEGRTELKFQWQALCRAAQILQLSGSGDIDDSASAISDSSSNAPAEVYQYFCVCRKMFLINEKITELSLDEAASMESSALFGNLADSASFAAKRAELTAALQEAEQEMEAQKETCLAHGLDPERYRHRRISSRSTDYATVTEWLDHSSGI